MTRCSSRKVIVRPRNNGWVWVALLNGVKVGSGFTLLSEAEAYRNGEKCLDEHRYDFVADDSICPNCGGQYSWNGQMCSDCGFDKESDMKRKAGMVWYNRETGEIFPTREEAMQDAAEQYDFGDETNMLTYLGFPNDELPYIEVDEDALNDLIDKFGWRKSKEADFWNPTPQAQKLMDIDNEIWDMHGWDSGNQVRENWDEYVSDVERSLGIYEVGNMVPGTIEDLEDNNYHSLCKAIRELAESGRLASRVAQNPTALRKKADVEESAMAVCEYAVDNDLDFEQPSEWDRILDYAVEIAVGEYPDDVDMQDIFTDEILEEAEHMFEQRAASRKIANDDEVEVVIDGEYCDGYAYIYEDGNENLVCDIQVDCWGENGEDFIDCNVSIPSSYSPQSIALELIGECEFEYGDELGIDEGHLVEQLAYYFKQGSRKMASPLDEPDGELWYEIPFENYRGGSRSVFASVNVDDVVTDVNASGDGMWDIRVDVRQNGDEYNVTLVDNNEFVSSYNYYESFIQSGVFKPIEDAVKAQTGDSDFFFDCYDAVTFVGTAIEGGFKFETGIWMEDDGAYHKYYTSDGEIAGVVGTESGTGSWIWGVDDHGDMHRGTCDSADDGMAQADAYVHQALGVTASRKTARMSLTKLKPLVSEFAQAAGVDDYIKGYIYDFLEWADEQSWVGLASRNKVITASKTAGDWYGRLMAIAEECLGYERTLEEFARIIGNDKLKDAVLEIERNFGLEVNERYFATRRTAGLSSRKVAGSAFDLMYEFANWYENEFGKPVEYSDELAQAFRWLESIGKLGYRRTAWVAKGDTWSDFLSDFEQKSGLDANYYYEAGPSKWIYPIDGDMNEYECEVTQYSDGEFELMDYNCHKIEAKLAGAFGPGSDKIDELRELMGDTAVLENMMRYFSEDELERCAESMATDWDYELTVKTAAFSIPEDRLREVERNISETRSRGLASIREIAEDVTMWMFGQDWVIDSAELPTSEDEAWDEVYGAVKRVVEDMDASETLLARKRAQQFSDGLIPDKMDCDGNPISVGDVIVNKNNGMEAEVWGYDSSSAYVDVDGQESKISWYAVGLDWRVKTASRGTSSSRKHASDEIVYVLSGDDYDDYTLHIYEDHNGWNATVLDELGMPTTYDTWGFDSSDEALDMFRKHRPMVQLASSKVAGPREELLELGVPESEIDSHEGDLYVKVSPLSDKWLETYENRNLVEKFVDEIDHEPWYEIPFGNY